MNDCSFSLSVSDCNIIIWLVVDTYKKDYIDWRTDTTVRVTDHFDDFLQHKTELYVGGLGQIKGRTRETIVFSGVE